MRGTSRKRRFPCVIPTPSRGPSRRSLREQPRCVCAARSENGCRVPERSPKVCACFSPRSTDQSKRRWIICRYVLRCPFHAASCPGCASLGLRGRRRDAAGDLARSLIRSSIPPSSSRWDLSPGWSQPLTRNCPVLCCISLSDWCVTRSFCGMTRSTLLLHRRRGKVCLAYMVVPSSPVTCRACWPSTG